MPHFRKNLAVGLLGCVFFTTGAAGTEETGPWHVPPEGSCAPQVGSGRARHFGR